MTAPEATAARLFRERVHVVSRHLPQAVAGAPEAVHQLRVACRRLRVTLPLVAAKPEGRRAQRVCRTLRLLTRAAGPARDLDVMLASLDEDLRARPKATPALRALRRRLQQARRLGRRRMSEALLDLDVARLRRDLRVLLARGSVDNALCLQRIHRRTVRELGALDEIFETLGRAFVSDRLHAARIAARRLRYVDEVRDVLLGLKGDWRRRLQEQQHLLGRVHDAWTLALWFGQQAERTAAHNQDGLAAEATLERKHFEAQARAAHQAWLASEPQALLLALRGA